MWYRNLVVFACAALIAAGCSSSPDVEDDEAPIEEIGEVEEAEAPRSQLVEKAYEDAAVWLPADAIGIYIQSTEPFWDQIGELALPVANPDAEAGSLGTLEGLREDLGEFTRTYFGFDTWALDTVAVAIHGGGGVGVAFGDIEETPDLPSVDIGGETVYVMDLMKFLEDDLLTSDLKELAGDDFDADDYTKLYLMPVDKPRTGFVGALDKQHLEDLLDNPDERLSESALDDDFRDYFARTEGAEVALVASLEAAEKALADLDDELADEIDDLLFEWLAFSYGDALTVTLTADQQTLEGVEAKVGEVIYEMQELIAEYSPEFVGSLYGDLALSYIEHKEASISSQLEPTWLGDKTLRYELALSGGHFTRAWAVSSLSMFFTVPLLWMSFDSFLDGFDDLDDMEPLDEYDVEYKDLDTEPTTDHVAN